MLTSVYETLRSAGRDLQLELGAHAGVPERLDELDLASQDVLIEVVRELEKQLWMLRSSLP